MVGWVGVRDRDNERLHPTYPTYLSGDKITHSLMIFLVRNMYFSGKGANAERCVGGNISMYETFRKLPFSKLRWKSAETFSSGGVLCYHTGDNIIAEK